MQLGLWHGRHQFLEQQLPEDELELQLRHDEARQTFPGNGAANANLQQLAVAGRYIQKPREISEAEGVREAAIADERLAQNGEPVLLAAAQFKLLQRHGHHGASS